MSAIDPTKLRPLPDRWAVEKAAFAEGKRIESRIVRVFRCGAQEITEWDFDRSPQWEDWMEYRIAPEQKPEPKWRDLTKLDVPPGSAITWGDSGDWELVTWVKDDCLATELRSRSYAALHREGAKILRPGGTWQPCKVEVTE